MMFLPFIVLFLSIFFSFLYGHNNKIRKNNYIVALFIIFAALQLLRLYCQQYFPDIPNYLNDYKNIKPLQQDFFSVNGISKYFKENFDNDIEIGYVLFSSISKTLGLSFSFFLLLISCIEFISISYFCKKMSINAFIVFPIYIGLTFLTFQIGMLRQALAFCVFLFAILYSERKIVYFSLILLGCLFHRSMVLCFFLFYINYKLPHRLVLLSFLVALILYTLQIDIVRPYWMSLQLENVGRINYYLSSDLDNSYLGVGFWERILFFCLMYAIYVKFESGRYLDVKYIKVFNLGVFSILFQLIFFSSPLITSRLRYYTVIFPAVFVSLYINEYANKNFRLGANMFIFLYLLLYLYFQGTYLVE